MHPLISILVPCFNVEKFVDQCLNSLKSQTLSNLEFICINDGSTDRTLQIIKSYASQDERFKIIDKSNTGYGASMNLGIELASADYIGIVESDDYVESNMFEELYNQANKFDLDISRCCFKTISNSRAKPNKSVFLPKNIVFTPTENVVSLRHPPSIWAAIYKKSFLDKHKIRFRESPGAAFQDLSFSFKTLFYAKRVRCLPDCLLNYRLHDSNSVKKTNNIFTVIDELDECLLHINRCGSHQDILRIFLQIEYDTFKWNYCRLTSEDANKFYCAWVKRWVLNSGYGIKPSLKNSRIYLYYLLITKFPNFFEKYLIKKAGR